MTVGALVFMIVSWSLVLGLAFWAFRRVLQAGGKPRGDGGSTGRTRNPSC